jgi:hypothetical protein
MKYLLKNLTLTRITTSITAGILFITLCHPTGTQAKPIFNVTADRSSIVLAKNSSTTDTFNVKNVSGVALPNIIFQASYKSTPYTHQRIVGGSCHNGQLLAAGGNCTFVESINSSSFSGENNIFPRVCGFGGAQACSTMVAGLPVTVSNKNIGHLVFRRNGVDITSLDINPAQSGTVKLFNTGKTPVHNSPSILHIANALKPGFTSDCGIDLAAGASCTITYTMATSTDGAPHIIMATASNADNSPQDLKVSVARLGHLVFQQSGQSISNIDLNPSQTGSVQLVNTGGTPITTTQSSIVTIPPALSPGFTTNCGTTLSANEGSCDITYSIPTTTGGTQHDIVADGTNADNNPHDLSVSVSSLGHFTFKKNGNIITKLDVTPSESGVVQLVNDGGTNISNAPQNVVTIPPALSHGFTTNCGTMLSANGGSCDITYSTPKTTDGTQHNIVAEGGTADNSPQNLPVSVSTPLAGSITTLFAANNRFAGNIFNVKNIAPTLPSIKINSFSINIDNTGSTNTICVYYRMGTSMGFQNSSVGWTSLGCDNNVVSQGKNNPTPVNVGNLILLPGELYGIYIDVQTYNNPGTSMEYTNGGPNVFSNGEVEITTYYGKGTPAFSGRTFFPRQWNGTIHYS